MLKNYYLEPECAKCILTISEMENIDGLGGRKPTSDIACDVFDTNANFVVKGKGVFVDCGHDIMDKPFWEEIYKRHEAASKAGVLHAWQMEFAEEAPHLKFE